MKNLRRVVRPAGKTLQAMARWKQLSFNEAPPVFGNSKPKSGSHLLLQILNGFTRIMPYKYVATDPVRTIRKNGGRRTDAEILADLRAIPNGVIGWGYVDATPENGRVWVSLGRRGDRAVVEVGDTGHGMTPEFIRERLFKPFQSTKQAGMGIGAYESAQYIRELGGELQVESKENMGTRVTMILPLFDAGTRSELHEVEKT